MMVGLPLAPADWLNDLLPAVAYTVYPMTGEPPSMAGGVKVIVAWFGPLATADTAVGAFGATIIGVIDTMGVVPGAGTMESAIHDSLKAMHEALDRAGVKNVFVESPGTAHEWQTWRRALHDFAPRLFRD